MAPLVTGLFSAPGLHLLRLSARPALGAGLAISSLGLLILLGQALAFAALAPGPAGVLALAAGLIPGVLALALPVGLFLGLVSAARSWAERGEWLALACSGAPARSVGGPVLALGLLMGAIQAGLTHGAEPLGRREARRTLAQAVGDLRLQPGRPVVLGDTLLVAGEADEDRLGDVLLAAGPVLTTARRAWMEGGGRIRLEDGEALGLSADPAHSTGVAWRLSFARAQLRLDLPDSRVELIERSTGELVAQIARARLAGDQAVAARRTLARRSALPASVPLLALLALPLGARASRPGLVAVGTVLGWWAVLRVADQVSAQIGPLAAAWAPFFVLAAVVALAWASWREG